MSKRTIPAHTITVCDGCGREESSPTRFFTMKTRLMLRRHDFDYQGSPATDGSRGWDLCDCCVIHVESRLDSILETLHKEGPK